jgi:predicted DCC family thiol-disulfide oxidoreductase YuxK
LRQNKIATDWNEFWFRRRDLTALGAFRIAIGLTALSKLLMLLPVLGDYFSEKGTLTLAQSQAIHAPPRICLFDFLPLEAAPAFFAVLIVVALLFTAGAYTRMTTVLLYVGMVSIDVRDPWIVNSGDRLLSILLFFGIFAPMGAALSADRLWSIYKGDVDRSPARGAYWAVRLMQFQVCSMYFWSTYIKCQGNSWPGGEAIYWTSRNIERSRFSLPFVTDTLVGINLLVYFTLLVEGLFPFLVWNKRTRPYAVAGGVLLHLGIEHMMTIQVFGFVVLSSYLLFFEGEEIRRAWDYLRWPVRGKRESVPVFYDGDCGFCTRCTWALESMDVLDRFRLLNFRDPKVQREFPDLDPERSEKELVLKTRQGKWYGGFYAFRWMFWRIPAMMPVTPLCYVPGVPWVGNKAYQWVADHRYLFKVDEGCACALPAAPPEKNNNDDSGG